MRKPRWKPEKGEIVLVALPCSVAVVVAPWDGGAFNLLEFKKRQVFPDTELGMKKARAKAGIAPRQEESK
jgi:hypothetical protein